MDDRTSVETPSSVDQSERTSQEQQTAADTTQVSSHLSSPPPAKDAPSSPIPDHDEDASEETRLAALVAGTRDQDDLERSIGRQADALLTEKANERDQKRLDKTLTDKGRLEGQIRRLQQKLDGFGNQATKNKIRAEIEHYKGQVGDLDSDLEQIRKRMDERTEGTDDTTLLEDKSGRLPGESQRDFLIRTGKITPFSKVGRNLLRTSSSLAEVMLDAEEEEDEPDLDALKIEETGRSHRDLMMPGFAEDVVTEGEDDEDDGDFEIERPAKRRRIQTNREKKTNKKVIIDKDESEDDESVNDDDEEEEDAYIPDLDDRQLAAIGASDDEEEPEDEDVEGDFSLATAGTKRKRGNTTSKDAARTTDETEDLTGIDDGKESVYQARLQSWVKRRSAARRKAKQHMRSDQDLDIDTMEEDTDEPEWHLPLPNKPDAEFEGGFKVPGDIFPSLFDYQKIGVEWLWELYSQKTGGIIGDEMGLGKTIQVISFIAGLHYSGLIDKPIIIVTPATILKQWVNEFHRWWPPLRVSILHTSGSGMLDVKREARLEDDLETRDYSTKRTKMSKSEKAAQRIVDKVSSQGGVLVTTYSGLQTYAEALLPVEWGYAVLDEGHKIRNPNTAITMYAKDLITHNRIILSGTPMQNNLVELWSLFDFCFPMLLGTLVSFRQHFELPIKQGGYANASNLQVETAMNCAVTLKEAISPYLLQRFKVDVASDLPKKTERVIFCKLTKLQREAYEYFLNSDDMRRILDGKRQALYGIDILRKICNHPDLVEHKTLSIKEDYDYGNGKKSGKMQVLKELLEIWRRDGHKTLLFAQHRIMLDILQRFLSGLGGFNFLRMDGNTSIKERQNLVDRFNKEPGLHVFLLTTKVGGLGVNLTGADRVIIYDPDWNPSTDVQARERAWRLGQKREVQIYRLMTAGTIEEKIYHRQIFKQFLTNKILRDPKQRQTFQLRDLHDLFTLGDSDNGETETGSLFKGTEVKLAGEGSAPTNGDATASGDNKEAEPTEAEKQKQLAEMSDITGIHRAEDFRTGNEDSEAAHSPAAADSSNPGDPSASNDRVLAGIFARSGVHSTLSHDDIIGSNSSSGKKKIQADPEIIAREARKVAAKAAAELRRAGEVARSLPAGSVSWTGTYGDTGRPDEGRPASSVVRGGGFGIRGGRGGRGGPSSASVLANLSSRQNLNPSTAARPGSASRSTTASASASRAGTPATQEHQPRGKEFLGLIRDYLIAHGGKVHTQMLIDHFNRFCGTQQRTAEFKEMLKTIAVLEPSGGGVAGRGLRGRGVGGVRGASGGRAKWVLKDEYRPKRE